MHSRRRILRSPMLNETLARAILLFKIKIKLIEMLDLKERMLGMRSAEYQATIPLKIFIIIHNYANV